MSQQVAADFLKRLNTDKDLRAKLSTLNKGYVDGLLNIAADIGFIFSADDWIHAVMAVLYPPDDDGELTDDELELVAYNSPPELKTFWLICDLGSF